MDADGKDARRQQVSGRSRGARDWELLGLREPYFSIVSTPEFRAEQASVETVERFYESGQADIARLRAWIAEDVGAPPAGRGLDIGCGAGRLTLAMAPFCTEVVGYDVSESLIAMAETRMRSGGVQNARFVRSLPHVQFDWISSYIVFQHIPPEEGMALLRSSLALAAPGAVASIQITFWREPHLAPKRSLVSHAIERFLDARARRGAGPVARLIRMHDYDLGATTKLFTDAGFSSLRLRATDHNGCHGFWMIGRRSD